MSDRIENFEQMGPRDCYDRGYDDGLKRGLERAEQIKLQYSAIEVERDWLRKKFAEYAAMEMPRPFIVDHLKMDSATLSELQQQAKTLAGKL